ncbi:putative AlsA ABC superfamily (atp_bind), allose transport protein (second module) [Clostridiales bacterium 1_7_47FAA]|nr:putative AlsA ABC superfamily (atp_bind), allose transport protein (second module) [Clostridiales bacterium 1_7_47FAA]
MLLNHKSFVWMQLSFISPERKKSSASGGFCKRGYSMDTDNAIEIYNVDKRYGGIYALKDVSFTVKRGHVHSLMGENGAGKSTLVKVLTSVIAKDSGRILKDGKELKIKNYEQAVQAGIALVPQELSFVDYFTVAENIYLGRQPLKKGTNLVDWKKMYKDAGELLERLHISLNPRALAKTLNVSDKQMMVIARILKDDADVIIFDEPTARLGHEEITFLLEYIKYLKTCGKSIIFISHHLEEVMNISDEVTVLRDGCVVASDIPITEIDEKKMIHLMVNRNVDTREDYTIGRVFGEEIFRVEHLTRKDLVKDACFSVRKGEVLGFFGLVGAGRTELMRSILGIDSKVSGDVYFEGKKLDIRKLKDSITAGIALIPEERRQQGLVLDRTLRDNIMLGCRQKISRFGFISRKNEISMSKEEIERMNLAYQHLEQRASELSGGNQQKLVIAKARCRGENKMYVFDEPTRGIDVGAKSEIYTMIAEMAKNGITSIVISSELPEIQMLCDRVIIMHEGQITGILNHEELQSAETVMKYAIGG